MVRQTVVGAVEVESLVLNACPEIPIALNEEAMSVAEIVVEGVAVAELAVVVEETTASGVVQFVIKKLARILLRRCRGRLRFVRRGPCDGGGGGTEKQADKEQSYVFHRLTRFGYRHIG